MSGVRTSGVYQPRKRGAALAETFENARREVMRFLRVLMVRGSGALVLGAGAAMLLALITYNPADPSANTATSREATNLLGPFGATAADLLLQYIGFASLIFLAAPIAWGTRALMGWNLDHARWRGAAWPLGVVFTAAGLGLLPGPESFAAGGNVGIFSVMMATRAAHAWGQPFIGWALPMLFLFTGLAFGVLATDIKLKMLAKGGLHALTLFYWIGSLFKAPEAKPVKKASRRVEPRIKRENAPEEESSDAPEYEEEIEEDEEQPSLDLAPAPGSRVKREEAKKSSAPKRAQQPALALASGDYELPPLGLLAEPVHVGDQTAFSDESLEENARMLESVLSDFGVKGRIVAVRPGPVVTLYEFEPAAGVKSSRVIALADDVARSMSAVAARIAVIPGRNVMGIELPNHTRETVYLRELLASAEFEKAKAPLILALGKTIGGEAVMADLAKMPHLLIAGTTGSGKSVAINTMILSLLYRLPPDQCKLIMIDPKMLELSAYDGIPHLLTSVVTDPRKAVVALKWAVREMEERYRKMSKLGVRGIEAFNDRVKKAQAKGEVLKRTVQTGFDRETGKPIYEDEVLELEFMPYIVVVVDEVADLMMVSGKEIEGAVQRLAQMARAAGIHLIAATQRPSVDVITGTIKANFPTRISFQVTSKIDSRTILGEQGAEQLLGQGDMLHMMAGGRIRRVHGPFVSDSEVEDVVRHLKAQGAPEYLDAVTEEPEEGGNDPFSAFGEGNGESGDDLYDKALAIVARERKATTSYIQRRLQIGYNRAARLIERMEEEQVISKPNHKGVREVLLPEHHE
ncbi:S-DNA-T family DNA segregation ATPase FtsK/SpoIIIE [Rhizomicrobium palustre]|uniref:DNA translocase FtsK n=1 Tax=Rhizomicrobium palustre TaxID=189966 RepID=A0A846MX58_9PROT|nr:DNA translocase FtsK 4TM domain-containing protein [Rhizomicrobium palustre]NIK87913.1 S-DNA-T family DNA segregation ATPase FtsK/SpoIIIE [Rhizomicrobium palustre]